MCLFFWIAPAFGLVAAPTRRVWRNCQLKESSNGEAVQNPDGAFAGEIYAAFIFRHHSR
jgi:hypothetical protein